MTHRDQAKRYEAIALAFYNNGDIKSGDRYRNRANREWRLAGKPQMIMQPRSLSRTRRNPTGDPLTTTEKWLLAGAGIAGFVAVVAYAAKQPPQSPPPSLPGT